MSICKIEPEDGMSKTNKVEPSVTPEDVGGKLTEKLLSQV